MPLLRASKLISISHELLKHLHNHARDWRPAECCALLMGRMDNKIYNISGAILCSNPTYSPSYFNIPVDEIIRGYKLAQKYNCKLIGVFHSHPSGFAHPSSTDKKYMAMNPGAWIIDSWTAMKGFTLEGEIDIKYNTHNYIIEKPNVIRPVTPF